MVLDVLSELLYFILISLTLSLGGLSGLNKVLKNQRKYSSPLLGENKHLSIWSELVILFPDKTFDILCG